MSAVLRAFEFAVFARTPTGEFHLSQPPPAWFEGFVCADIRERFPFLEAFLPDAEQFWAAKQGGVLRSDFWTENDDAGHPHHLCALAAMGDAGHHRMDRLSVRVGYRVQLAGYAAHVLDLPAV